MTVTPLDKKPMMILICQLSFAHYQNGSVILKHGYMKRTTEAFPMVDIVVEGAYDERSSICASVIPVKARDGKELTGKLVFVDQFNRKHVSDKVIFRPSTMPDDFIKDKNSECFSKLCILRPAGHV